MFGHIEALADFADPKTDSGFAPQGRALAAGGGDDFVQIPFGSGKQLFLGARPVKMPGRIRPDGFVLQPHTGVKHSWRRSVQRLLRPTDGERAQ